MLKNKKICVVLPAYNAADTLEKTYREIPFDIVDEVVLVDDCSHDGTVEVGKKLGIQHIIRHDRNKGYGGNLLPDGSVSRRRHCGDAAS